MWIPRCDVVEVPTERRDLPYLVHVRIDPARWYRRVGGEDEQRRRLCFCQLPVQPRDVEREVSVDAELLVGGAGDRRGRGGGLELVEELGLTVDRALEL